MCVLPYKKKRKNWREIMTGYKDLLQELQRQEEELQFSGFTNETALTVGMALLKEARKRDKPLTIDIMRSGQQLFHFAMAGTTIDNDEWIKRKNNVVNRFGHSSFFMGIALKSAEKTIEEKYLISSSTYAAHGGAFPLIIKNVGMVGTITVSGLPQQEDHELVVLTLRRFLADEKE
jgi:uncharacterized protein (UPF0303 family)